MSLPLGVVVERDVPGLATLGVGPRPNNMANRSTAQEKGLEEIPGLCYFD
jgi:hypothetical protein